MIRDNASLIMIKEDRIQIRELENGIRGMIISYISNHYKNQFTHIRHRIRRKVMAVDTVRKKFNTIKKGNMED